VHQAQSSQVLLIDGHLKDGASSLGIDRADVQMFQQRNMTLERHIERQRQIVAGVDRSQVAAS